MKVARERPHCMLQKKDSPKKIGCPAKPCSPKSVKKSALSDTCLPIHIIRPRVYKTSAPSCLLPFWTVLVEVVGALYGDRRLVGKSSDCPDISPFEAKLVEVLASGIAAGMARIKEEQAAMAARVQFEQFFTPQLASQLEKDPQLLEGSRRTNYFALRRHSRI